MRGAVIQQVGLFSGHRRGREGVGMGCVVPVLEGGCG